MSPMRKTSTNMKDEPVSNPNAGQPGTERAQQELIRDAYFASYKGPTEMLEVVHGTDQRKRVRDTTCYPNRCIASLVITDQDGIDWSGTGWLIGPRILLTAGHCVYLANYGGWASRIEVIPGRDGTKYPYPSCVATDFRCAKGWINDKDREYDYGAILLPKDFRLGLFGLTVASDDQLKSMDVTISGYPGDKPEGTQWWQSNRIAVVKRRLLEYDIDTAGGQSGAPVYVKKEEGNGVSFYGVGIHTNGDKEYNIATRITKHVYDDICAWRKEVS